MANLNKRDKVGARTPAALDRQYNLGGLTSSLNKTLTKQSKQTEQLLKEVEENLNNVVTEDKVQEMIDTSLGVIENGSY